MNKKYTLVIDGDTPLFRAAKALQKDYIEVQYKDTDSVKEFKNRTEFKGSKKLTVEGWLGDLNNKRKIKRQKPFLLKDFTITDKSKVVAKDDNAKRYLVEYITELYQLPWVKEIKWILAGGDNFRYNVFPDYKAGRPPKPLRFKAIKDWFCREFEDITTLSEGCESDDYCSIMGWWAFRNNKDDICIGGIDKDLLQIPGFHFNLDKRGDIQYIDEYKAIYNLCVQLLIGDITDNIQGLPKANKELQERYVIGKGGIGPSKAKKILKSCDTIECLLREVEEAYRCYYKEEYKQPLNQTYKLIKLMERLNQEPEWEFKK